MSVPNSDAYSSPTEAKQVRGRALILIVVFEFEVAKKKGTVLTAACTRPASCYLHLNLPMNDLCNASRKVE